MARIVVNPGSPNEWVQELEEGTFSLGCGNENQVVLNHTSVSTVHCQLTLSNGGAVLKDLGSANGTTVAGELVDEVALVSGQTFRVGEVELQFVNEHPAEVPVPLARPMPVATAARAKDLRCKNHPGTRARYECAACGTAYCDFCVSTRMERGVARKYCRACGRECDSIKLAFTRTAAPGFYKSIPGAFAYPLRGNGLFLLLAGGIFFVILGFLPIIGLLLTGYLFGYAKKIVACTAIGEDDPPDWPDFTNWGEDLLWPYFQLFVLTLLAFGPAILLHAFLPPDFAGREVIIVAGVAFGVILAPMGMLALAMLDTLGALNPIGLVWSISRIPVPYFVASVAFGLAIGGYFVGGGVLTGIMPHPILAYIVSGFTNLYFVAVAMRILGLLYRDKKDELAWH